MTTTDFNQIREEFIARFKPDRTAEIAELENAFVSLELSIASHRDSFQHIEKEEKKLLLQFKDTDVVANPDQMHELVSQIRELKKQKHAIGELINSEFNQAVAIKSKQRVLKQQK